MRNFKVEVIELLERKQLKEILGGSVITDDNAGTCSADCIDKHGNTSTVTCSGTNCSATNFVGCTSNTDEKSCPS